ncbi:hypothetical protein L13192_07109 [Pyrenophora tritici-repentis]|nr:hypothetical protein L13192_07109 [Pyrenophora tritici-repentis]
MLETYASSILGLDILRGLELYPIFPLNTPTPVFTGDATDATAVAAFTTTLLRFLDALEPVLLDYCFRRRKEIRRNIDATAAAARSIGLAGAHIFPVTLSSIINELCDKAKIYHEAFKTTFAASAYLRQPKPTSNGNGNNKKDNKDNTSKPKIAYNECGKLHKGSRF